MEKTRDPRHDRSGVFPRHMAQLQIFVMIAHVQRRSPLLKGCSLICVHITAFHNPFLKRLIVTSSLPTPAGGRASRRPPPEGRHSLIEIRVRQQLELPLAGMDIGF